MKVGKSCSQQGGWDKPGLIGSWPRPSQTAMASQTVLDEKSAGHVSNFGVTWFQTEVDMGTRDWRSQEEGSTLDKCHLVPVLGEASSLDEPKKNMVTSTKNHFHYWFNKPLVKFSTLVEIIGIYNKIKSHHSLHLTKKSFKMLVRVC